MEISLASGKLNLETNLATRTCVRIKKDTAKLNDGYYDNEKIIRRDGVRA